jgi:C4-dicarboxylate transporter
MVPPQFGHSFDASVLVGCFLSVLLTSSRGLVIRFMTRLARVIIRKTIRRRTGTATIATDIKCSIVIEGYKVCISKTDLNQAQKSLSKGSTIRRKRVIGAEWGSSSREES